jgi:hypothetical protein
MTNTRKPGALSVCTDAILDHEMTTINAHVDPVAEQRHGSTSWR